MAARSTENQVAFREQNGLPAVRSDRMQLSYRSCAKSRRVLDDIDDGGTSSPGEDSEKIGSYSLCLVSIFVKDGKGPGVLTPTRRGSQPVSIALLALAGLPTAATSPGRRSSHGFDCLCSALDDSGW